MAEYGTANVGSHALAHPRHQEKAGVGYEREHDDDPQQRKQRLVEQFRAGGAEALVDDVAQALADYQRAGRRHHQSDQRDEYFQTVGPGELEQAPQLAQIAAAGSKRKFGL